MKDTSFLFLFSGLKICPSHVPIVSTGALKTKERLAWEVARQAGGREGGLPHRLAKVEWVPGSSDSGRGRLPQAGRDRSRRTMLADPARGDAVKGDGSALGQEGAGRRWQEIQGEGG